MEKKDKKRARDMRAVRGRRATVFFIASFHLCYSKRETPAVLSLIYEEANDPALSIKVYTERLRPKGLPFSGFWYLKEGKFVFSVCKKTKRANRCILRL